MSNPDATETRDRRVIGFVAILGDLEAAGRRFYFVSPNILPDSHDPSPHLGKTAIGGCSWLLR